MVLACVLALASVGLADAGEQTIRDRHGPAIVKTELVYPKAQRILVKDFEPWAEPTRTQVFRIIAEEARLWGASAGHLHSRIRCESGYRWWIVNGGDYAGLGQFGANAFARGVANLGTRRVRIVDRKRVRRHVRLVRTYSNGRRTVDVLKRTREVKLIVIRKGKLPARPHRLHPWVQVRIMARQIGGHPAGVSGSEWACG